MVLERHEIWQQEIDRQTDKFDRVVDGCRALLDSGEYPEAAEDPYLFAICCVTRLDLSDTLWLPRVEDIVLELIRERQ